MIKKCILFVAAIMVIAALAGCSRSNESDVNQPDHSNKPMTTDSGNQDGENDSFEGGGAGGTNSDHGNTDSDEGPYASDGNMLDDIGDAAGDLVDGAGRAIQDIGDAMNGHSGNTPRSENYK